MKAEMAASWAFRSRGLVGALVGGACGTLVLISAPGLPLASWASAELRAAGWLVFIAGAALRFWATLYIGGKKGLRVVHEGPYSLCRNPLYVGTFLIALSAALMMASLTLIGGVIVGAMFYAWATVPAEERYLASRLGEPYHRYCQHTPRFWPRWSSFRTPRTVTVSVKALRLEMLRAVRWVWLPVLADLAVQLRSEPWWPHWLRLP